MARMNRVPSSKFKVQCSKILRPPLLVKDPALPQLDQVPAIDQFLRLDGFCPRIRRGNLVKRCLQRRLLNFQTALQSRDFRLISRDAVDFALPRGRLNKAEIEHLTGSDFFGDAAQAFLSKVDGAFHPGFIRRTIRR